MHAHLRLFKIEYFFERTIWKFILKWNIDYNNNNKFHFENDLTQLLWNKTIMKEGNFLHNCCLSSYNNKKYWNSHFLFDSLIKDLICLYDNMNNWINCQSLHISFLYDRNKDEIWLEIITFQVFFIEIKIQVKNIIKSFRLGKIKKYIL